jgi:Bacterial Ig-like domain (group 3)/Domain of unknown function (DUF4214)
MRLLDWFRGRSRNAGRPRPSCRLELEQLEGRVVPAAVGTPQQDYVAQLYLDLLGRSADAPSLNADVAFLNQGGSRQQVVGGILGSSEYHTVEINHAYDKFLGRDADPSGLAGFLDYLNHGGTLVQLEADIVGSPEYLQKAGGTNDAFLQALYTDALGRLVDSSGQQAYDGQLNAGVTKAQVAAEILTAVETEAREIGFIYQNDLRRDPSADEVSGWVPEERVTGIEGVIAGIVSSDEYFQLATTNATHLSFLAEPSHTAGTDLNVIVAAVDDSGNVDRTFTGSTTLAIHTGPSGGVLSGSTTEGGSRGFVTFDVSLNKAGSYTLAASASGLATGVSAPITITPAAATHLVVNVPTSPAIAAGGSFTVSSTAQDQFGNTDTNYNNQSEVLTINSGTSGAILSGTLTATASAGAASFNVSVDSASAGTPYTLKAASGSLAGVSNSFTVGQVTPTVSITPNPTDTGTPVTSYTFTAHVTGVTGVKPPTDGSMVQFYVDNALFDTQPLTNGRATSKSTSTLAPGTAHPIKAVYLGDSNYVSGAESPPQTVTPSLHSVTVAFTSPAPAPIDLGTSTGTYTVSVTDGGAPLPPGGTVQFTVDGTLFDTVSVPGGSPTGSAMSTAIPNPPTYTTYLDAAHSPHMIVATYYLGGAPLGSTDGQPGSATAPLSQAVNPGVPTITTFSSTTTGTNDPTFSLTVIVTGVKGFAPGKTVTFSGGTVTANLPPTYDPANGTLTETATFTFPDAPGEPYPTRSITITASYTGDSANYTAASNTKTITFTSTEDDGGSGDDGGETATDNSYTHSA